MSRGQALTPGQQGRTLGSIAEGWLDEEGQLRGHHMQG